MTLREVSETLKNSAFVDPLRDFSEACREELRKIVLGPRIGRRIVLGDTRGKRMKSRSHP